MLPLIVAALLLLANVSFAHCPICFIATGSSVAMAKWLGVSDAAVGTLIGVFTVSTALWLDVILKKRNKGNDYVMNQSHIIVLGSLALTFGSYFASDTMSDAARVIPNIDDLSAGTLIGSIIGLGAFVVHNRIRKANGGRNVLPFQVVVVLIAAMALSMGVYHLSGYLTG
jgi:hypothetical protein